MPSVSLEAIRLTKQFGVRTAVREINFTAGEGEILGLLGPNGAGKTTTIRLLTTVLTPTSGQFSVAGIPSSRATEIRRRVGVLPESAGYPAHQTGREYLRYHARLFGQPRRDAEQIAERLLTDVGLAERGSSRIATYSRGMRQRLGIARALVNDPAVVFLDEPTLGLDPAGQRQVLRMVREIAIRRGATVVLSTHTLPEVEEVCSTVLILDRGSVVRYGTVGEVTRAVAAPQSAQLRVPPDQVDRACTVLAGLPGLSVDPGGAPSSPIGLSLSGERDGTHDGRGRLDQPASDMNDALRVLLDAGVPVLAFEVEGARLSDAFLAMTRESIR